MIAVHVCVILANGCPRTSSKNCWWRIRLGLWLVGGGSALDETLHTRRTDSRNRLTFHLAKIAPVLMTTNAIENTNILKSFPAAPPSTINSANPNFLTPGWPGGRISLSYLFTNLVNPFTPLGPDHERTLELIRDASSIGSEMSDDPQEVQLFRFNLSFHSRPCSVTGSPCVSHVSSNFPTSRKFWNSKMEVNRSAARGIYGAIWS